MALRNIFRQKFRLIMTLGTLTIAGTLLISVINLRNALEVDLYKILKMYDLIYQMSLGDSYNREYVEGKAQSLEAVQSAEGRVYANAQRILGDGSLSNALIVSGVNLIHNLSTDFS